MVDFFIVSTSPEFVRTVMNVNRNIKWNRHVGKHFGNSFVS